MAQRILIVDDSRLTRAIIKNALTAAGFEVVGEAENGRDAITKFGQLKPDMVTMDLIMPDVDGMQATKEILSKDPKARILVVTSLGQKLLEEDAMKTGAKGMIAKPFQPQELVKAVNDVLTSIH
jgi:two-component system, chemotaxis family, chemotaxis protein CheY